MLAELDRGFAWRGGGANPRTVRGSRWDASVAPGSLGAIEHSIGLLSYWLAQRRAILARNCPAERATLLELHRSIATRLVALAQSAKRGTELPPIDDAELRSMIRSTIARLRQPDATDMDEHTREAEMLRSWRRSEGLADVQPRETRTRRKGVPARRVRREPAMIPVAPDGQRVPP
jgi:hypothetical protein